MTDNEDVSGDALREEYYRLGGEVRERQSRMLELERLLRLRGETIIAGRTNPSIQNYRWPNDG